MPRLVAEFLAWYNSQPKDIGNTTRAALARLAAGVAWDQAGGASDVGSGRGVGNGSIMRCAPVALRFRRDRGKLVAASLDSARVTHAHPLCLWSAVAVNQAIAHLLNGGPVAQVTAAAVDGIAEPAVRDTVLNAAARPRDLVQSGGHVLATLGAAVWCLLRHDTLEETLVAAVALGDDTDTTGAVVGALAGAYFGMAAIPDRWLTRLQPRDELTALAHQLLAHSKSNASGQIFRAD
jgi:ADP-ribosyl-[dinitrogen reductase] hydrolase